MKTADFSYFIERYNAGEMSESEKLWFTKELDRNESLRKEVDLRKRTDEILKDQDVLSLRSKLASIERSRKSSGRPSKTPKKIQYIRYAAVITALVLISSMILYNGKNTSSEKLMQHYYKTYEPQTGQRSASTVKDADFNLAVEFYNTHDYERAAEFFTKVLDNRPNDMQVELLNGVSNFEQKKYPEAKQSFSKVIDNRTNLFVDQARWYLALCYVNTHENAKAKDLFSIIIKEDGIYKDEAKKLLKSLR